MEQFARITHIFTKDYVEINLDGVSAVAECLEKVERGDRVSVTPAEPKQNRLAALAYLMPLVAAVIGFVLSLSQGGRGDEALAMAFILGGITLGTAWIMNRRARLRRRIAYSILRVCAAQEQ